MPDLGAMLSVDRNAWPCTNARPVDMDFPLRDGQTIRFFARNGLRRKKSFAKNAVINRAIFPSGINVSLKGAADQMRIKRDRFRDDILMQFLNEHRHEFDSSFRIVMLASVNRAFCKTVT